MRKEKKNINYTYLFTSVLNIWFKTEYLWEKEVYTKEHFLHK